MRIMPCWGSMVSPSLALGLRRVKFPRRLVHNLRGFATSARFRARRDECIHTGRKWSVRAIKRRGLRRARLQHREVCDHVATLGAFPLAAAYTASKQAIEGFTGSLAHGLAHFGIRTKLVEPGYVPTTNFGANAIVPFDQLIPADYADFAGPIIKAFGKPALTTKESDVAEGVWNAIPLPDASVDAVVCAQAFRWFATVEAVAEMRRVLVPGGTLGLIWNGRDESVPWVAALFRITNRREGDTPRYRTGAWRKALPAPGLKFIGKRHVRNHHIGSAEQVVLKRTMSVSFIAGLPADERHEVEREVRDLIDGTPELSGGQQVAFLYETSMFAYRAI
jgi:SAM-dependent methyltransferase